MARILVVDDDAYVRGAVRRVLVHDGHNVWDAADGSDALQMLEVSEFDLVVTDVYMDRMDGMEFMRRARQRGFRVPMVVMTGGGLRPRGGMLRLARALGAAATIEKPFSSRSLRAVVGTSLQPSVG